MLIKYRYILTYILFVLIILFTVAQVIKTKTNFYSENVVNRWNNILSYDDIYYAREIYTEDPQYSGIQNTIIKHPLISIIGQEFAKLETIFFNNNDNTDHYFNIVLFQIIINIIGIFYLYKILR